MSAIVYCWNVVVGVFVPTNQLIPLAELSRDVRAVVKTTGFSANPTVLISNGSRRRIQS
jgi:hypothetical protein